MYVYSFSILYGQPIIMHEKSYIQKQQFLAKYYVHKFRNTKIIKTNDVARTQVLKISKYPILECIYCGAFSLDL